jgi:hypothetical protein
MSSSDEDDPSRVEPTISSVISSLALEKSRGKYQFVYDRCDKWCEEKMLRIRQIQKYGFVSVFWWVSKI